MTILTSALRSVGTQWRSRLVMALLRAWLKLAPESDWGADSLLSQARATGSRSELRRACEAVLAAKATHAEALLALADLCLAEIDPVAARDLYARHADAVQDPVKPHLYRNAYMQPARAAAHEPYVHTLRNVLLDTERSAVFDGDNIYIRETGGTNLENHPSMKVRATPGREYFLIPPPQPVRVVDRPVVLIGTDGAINYGHWLNRDVLKLALLEPAGVPASLPLLINEDLSAYQIELLDVLQIPADRLFPVPRNQVIQFRELVVPVLLRNHPRMRVGIDWLRNRVARLMAPAGEASDLLYISRRDSKNHALLNEAEVEEALRQRGFKVVALTGMPFTEQVRTFSRARVIVGAMGAGLSNLMFAPSHAQVIEITNSNLRHMAENRKICDQMGMRYVEILSDDFPPSQPTEFAPYFNYFVETAAVIAAVEEILSGRADTGRR